MAIDISPRQSQIIDAAGLILTRSGISGLTIKNLASEMRFTESALYRHFKSKEEIILLMLEYLAETLDGIFTSAYVPEDRAEEKLRKLFHARQEFFKSKPHFAVVVFSDGLMSESAAINTSVRHIMAIKQKHLKPILMEGQDNGEFTRDLSVEELSHLLMGSLRLHMLKWRMEGFQFDIVTTGGKRLQNILKLIKIP